MSEKYQYIKTTAKDLKEIYKNETMDKIFEDFAEALNDYQDFGCESCKAQDELKDKIVEIESKLAESLEIIRLLKMSNDALREDNLDLSYNQVDNVYETAIEMSKGWEEQYQQEIAQLKQQLAEEKNRSKKLNHEAQKYYEDAYCNGFQNKKAIEQLEKVKEWLEPKYFDKEQINYLAKAINQQIKSLKGEK